jgi:hypothetical protein
MMTPGTGDRSAVWRSVVVLVLNDNAFGFVKWEQQNKGFASFVWITRIGFRKV